MSTLISITHFHLPVHFEIKLLLNIKILATILASFIPAKHFSSRMSKEKKLQTIIRQLYYCCEGIK